MIPAPRRYATTDPAYNAEIGQRVIVTVDGDMLRHVVAYDCDEGWIDAVAHNEYGVMVEFDGQYVTRRYFGEVKAMLV